MKKKIAFLFSVLFFLLLFPLTVSAHPGGTDSRGGHYNHDTGEYHYHHGYPAHSHYDMDGDGDIDCPYEFEEKTDDNTTYKDKTDRKLSNNIIGLLNSTDSSGNVLWWIIIAFIPASVVLKLLFKIGANNRILGSFCDTMSELNVLAIFGILLFLLVPAILFIGSIQAMLEYGVSLIFPLIVFWGIAIIFVAFFIRAMRKR